VGSKVTHIDGTKYLSTIVAVAIQAVASVWIKVSAMRLASNRFQSRNHKISKLTTGLFRGLVAWAARGVQKLR
jgi:hypothetical protein